MSTPTLLCTLDAVREDYFTPEHFPRIDPYLDDFALFSNAWSHGVATPFAFPHLLTGNAPTEIGALNGSTITDRLNDIRSVGFGNNPHLIPDRGYDSGLSTYHHSIPPATPTSQTFGDRLKEVAKTLPISTQLHWLYQQLSTHTPGVTTNPGYSRAKAVTTFIREQFRRDPDSFVWAHFMNAHQPFDPKGVVNEPSLPDRETIERHTERFLTDGEDCDLELIKKLYATNIRYLDHHLGELFESLRSCGIYEEMLIVLTADHGELFGEHGRTHHPYDIDPPDELLQIPLLVKFPEDKDAGVTYDHMVSHADIPATILNTQSGMTDSHSPTLRTPQNRTIVSLSNTALRVTTDGGHYLMRRNGETVNKELLTPKMESYIEDVSIPRIAHTDGTVAGVAEAERERRLAQLGYR